MPIRCIKKCRVKRLKSSRIKNIRENSIATLVIDNSIEGLSPTFFCRKEPTTIVATSLPPKKGTKSVILTKLLTNNKTTSSNDDLWNQYLALNNALSCSFGLKPL